MNLQDVQRVRLILHDPQDGRWNMAVDESLLAGVADGTPVIRLYGFAPATLSVGRFQRVRSRVDPDALSRAGITLVRRPTGGQAVLHDDELTYAVVIGRQHIEPFRKREVYRFIAGLLLRGLERLGVRGRSSQARTGGLHNPDCFRSTGEYEIADLSQRKLIGSAQILTRSGSLQHGAIPLSDSYRRIAELMDLGPGTESRASGAPPADAPHGEPSSLNEALGRDLSFLEARQEFTMGFEEELRRAGVELVRDELSPDEQRRAIELREMRYERDEWNLKY